MRHNKEQIEVLVLSLIIKTRKLKIYISMENWKISSDSGQGSNEWQTVWRVTMISVVTLDKVKLTGMYGGVQFQFWH